MRESHLQVRLPDENEPRPSERSGGEVLGRFDGRVELRDIGLPFRHWKFWLVRGADGKAGDHHLDKFQKVMLVALLVFVGLTIWFWQAPDNSATSRIVQFIASGIGVAAAVASAAYVGIGLQEGNRQRRVESAFQYALRWQAPEFKKTRRSWGKIASTVKPSDIVELLGKNPKKKHHAFEMFALFEEMALGLRMGMSDESTLKRLFKGIVIRSYRVAEPWIASTRLQLGSDDAWCEFEWLHEKWAENSDRVAPKQKDFSSDKDK